MKEKLKYIIKRIVPQAMINIARGTIRRFKSGFAPVTQCYMRGQLFCLTDDKYDYVGGYYDVTPFSPQDDNYLMLRLNNDSDADIILYDLNSKSGRVINKTKAVNRQQGSRLRWDLKEIGKYYYNDYLDGKYVCVASLIDSETKEIVGPAFYDMSQSAGFGLSLDFGRLGKMRAGYGYVTVPYEKQTDKELLKEGIDYCDLHNGTIKRLLSYYDMIELSGWSQDNVQRYYINHICINPSGDCFTFFWIDAMDSDSNLKAELYIYNLSSGSIRILEKKERVSHYAWKNENEILVTLLDSQHNCTYVIIDVRTGKREKIEIDNLYVDGHPSWIDNRFFITDTYPDHYGYQSLLLIDSVSGEKKALLKMYHTCRCIGEKRCDMHPRLSTDKNFIAFDGNIHGVRNVYIASIKEKMNE